MEKLQTVFDIRAEHGEGPVWDPVEQELYWVDLIQGKYYKGKLASGEVEMHYVGQPLGVLALRRKQGLVMAVRDGFALWHEDARHLRLIDASPGFDNPDIRFNDGAVDPAGRFFAGTMEWTGSAPVGKLYRLDPDFSITLLEENIYITNGMGWSPDRNSYYLIDTLRHVLYAYDYDLTTGNITNRRNHIRFSGEELPDGMTIDSEGCFWIAFYGGGKVCRFDPEGKKMMEVLLPVSHPTSCCFGGPERKTLFITTSQITLSDRQKSDAPLAGRLFALETGVRGMTEPRFGG